jgi:hypothetical protein
VPLLNPFGTRVTVPPYGRINEQGQLEKVSGYVRKKGKKKSAIAKLAAKLGAS